MRVFDPIALRNSVGIHHLPDNVNGAFMSFDRQHQFIKLLLDNVPSIYQPHDYNCIGPKLLTYMIRSLINDDSSEQQIIVNRSSSTIIDNWQHTIRLIEPHRLYPIYYWDMHLLVDDSQYNRSIQLIDNAFTVHLWRHWLHDAPTDIGHQSFIGRTMTERCDRLTIDKRYAFSNHFKSIYSHR